jgi:hypothetical protein
MQGAAETWLTNRVSNICANSNFAADPRRIGALQALYVIEKMLFK